MRKRIPLEGEPAFRALDPVAFGVLDADFRLSLSSFGSSNSDNARDDRERLSSPERRFVEAQTHDLERESGFGAGALTRHECS